MVDYKFNFTITEVARLLGKSPVTLRLWERKGDYKFPRVGGKGSKRHMTLDDILSLSYWAAYNGRITEERHSAIVDAVTALRYFELF